MYGKPKVRRRERASPGDGVREDYLSKERDQQLSGRKEALELYTKALYRIETSQPAAQFKRKAVQILTYHRKEETMSNLYHANGVNAGSGTVDIEVELGEGIRMSVGSSGFRLYVYGTLVSQ